MDASCLSHSSQEEMFQRIRVKDVLDILAAGASEVEINYTVPMNS
jgi:hypothetical protein